MDSIKCEVVLDINYTDPKERLPEEDRSLLLKVNYDDFGEQFCYHTSGCYENGEFYTFNGKCNSLDPGEEVVGWRYVV